jgi:hypothetical protein
MNEMTAQIEFEGQEMLEECAAQTLSEDQLAMIAGGQCTTNSI